ncbi:C-4 sterol methyl oxidase [Myotisia sp. PD_48]|nr:C-4 sterol methyl oxidase [Myotisia sp. PD_48]
MNGIRPTLANLEYGIRSKIRWKDVVEARKMEFVSFETGFPFSSDAWCVALHKREISPPWAEVPSRYRVKVLPAAVTGPYLTNSTTLFASTPDTYWGQFNQISSYNPQLNVLERLWAAWYAYMQNDVLATGIMSFVMHEIVYFGRSLPWIIVDRMSYFNRYKIQNTKIPTVQEQWNCAKLVLLSHFTVELPQIWLFHPMAQFFGLATGVPFPSIWKILYQIAIFFVLEDTWHYFAHRAFHWGPLYKAVHKIHHQYSAPFGLAAEYASPIEVMALGFGTVGCPILWCAITGDLHILTMHLWIVCRLFQAIDAHSGYEFPWSLHHFLPFWAGADHHDVHHEKFVGNYASSFRWWDYLLDTEYSAEAVQRRREQKAKKIR